MTPSPGPRGGLGGARSSRRRPHARRRPRRARSSRFRGALDEARARVGRGRADATELARREARRPGPAVGARAGGRGAAGASGGAVRSPKS